MYLHESVARMMEQESAHHCSNVGDVDNPPGIAVVHKEWRLLNDVMAHDDDQVGVSHHRVHVVAVAERGSAHPAFVACELVN